MNKRTPSKYIYNGLVMRMVCIRSASRRGRPREETSTSTDSTQHQPAYRMTVQNVDDPNNNNRSFLVLKDPNNNSDQLADSRWLGRGDKPPAEGEKWVPSWADGKASR